MSNQIMSFDTGDISDKAHMVKARIATWWRDSMSNQIMSFDTGDISDKAHMAVYEGSHCNLVA